ncbi:MAG: glycosyltransferase family 2 protein [Candidatus Berkelbacteria bacterium]|nr:glycosyltransferase family 2 protein [Candidatus Berkelbacteria bacterium]
MSKNQYRSSILSTEMLRLGLLYLKRYGIKRFGGKLLEKIRVLLGLSGRDFRFNYRDYQRWIMANEPSKLQLDQQRQHALKLPNKPRISIIVPLWRTKREFLVAMLDSVRAQTYHNWELCLAAASIDDVRSTLEQYSRLDERIKVRYLPENEGIALNSNQAIKLATGEYVGLLDHDDVLAPNALYEIAKKLNEKNYDIVYSDEDKIDETGSVRIHPHFKPDWNPDLLRSYNYISHFFVISRDLLDKIGGFRTGFEGSQDHDLILRATEKSNQIGHIPMVLYHWRAHPNSTALDTSSKGGAQVATIKAVEEHLQRIGRKGTVSEGPFSGSVLTSYPVIGSPLVSIIIPNQDHPGLLRDCISSIRKATTYQNYEVIVVENGSQQKETFELYDELRAWDKFKLLRWSKQYNYAAINNFAAAQAGGEYILFLNNDISVITPGWLDELVGQCQWKENAAVGAKLYYADGSIQHAGVVVGLGGIAGHVGRLFRHDAHGYFGSLELVENLSAVTGACLLVKASKFKEVGGFNEDFAMAFNDIDLCLRLIKSGQLVVWTPSCELYHYESKTRGLDNTNEKRERLEKEEQLFAAKYGSLLQGGDPYYNRNLSLDTGNYKVKI